MLSIAVEAILRFHKRNQVIEEVLLESLPLHFVLGSVSTRSGRTRHSKTERHYDHERLELSIGNQVIEDDVGAATLRPGGLVVAGTV
jgi:hypothetical protein